MESPKQFGRGGFHFFADNVLYNIVDAYNKQEASKAKKEHRKPEMMPRISAHILRHTGCTRIAFF